MRDNRFTYFENVRCVDRLAICDYIETFLSYIIDQAVRYKTNDPEQAQKIKQEKKGICEKCLNYLAETFWNFRRPAEEELCLRRLIFLVDVGIDPK